MHINVLVRNKRDMAALDDVIHSVLGACLKNTLDALSRVGVLPCPTQHYRDECS